MGETHTMIDADILQQQIHQADESQEDDARSLIHPGEIVLEEFMKPHKMEITDLVERTGLVYQRIWEIVTGKRRITAETAVKFSEVFDVSPMLFLNLQAAYDLKKWQIKAAEGMKRVPEMFVPTEDMPVADPLEIPTGNSAEKVQL